MRQWSKLERAYEMMEAYEAKHHLSFDLVLKLRTLLALVTIPKRTDGSMGFWSWYVLASFDHLPGWLVNEGKRLIFFGGIPKFWLVPLLSTAMVLHVIGVFLLAISFGCVWDLPIVGWRARRTDMFLPGPIDLTEFPEVLTSRRWAQDPILQGSDA